MRRAHISAAALALCALCGAGPATAQARHAERDACAAFSFRIYFQPDSSSLNAPARDLIAAASRRAANCAAPALSFAASGNGDDALLTSRKAAILSALRTGGVMPEPIDAARASLIASPSEPAPAYIQVSVAATAGEALAAERQMLPRPRLQNSDTPTS